MSSNSLSNLSSPSAGGPSGGASSVGQRKDTRRTPIPGAGEDDYDDDDDDLAELREREREARENRKVSSLYPTFCILCHHITLIPYPTFIFVTFEQILDLEISNASLLAINVTLEKTKLKQSSEIRDLKRRLRDRSYAPPLSSPSLLASLDASSQYSDQQPFQANNPLSDDEDGEPEPDIETLIMEDHSFAEVCRTIEKLLRRATEAVKNKVEVDKAGARVLSALTFDNNEDDDDHVGERSFVVDGDGDGGGALRLSRRAENKLRSRERQNLAQIAALESEVENLRRDVDKQKESNQLLKRRYDEERSKRSPQRSMPEMLKRLPHM